jgi:hypothetical protein
METKLLFVSKEALFNGGDASANAQAEENIRKYGEYAGSKYNEKLGIG